MPQHVLVHLVGVEQIDLAPRVLNVFVLVAHLVLEYFAQLLQAA